ncbi:MAG: 50S ribosomal protein L23 [Victivallaceae bacterium]|nr:50S ribosomal protein L23 [Victivallaceae bacterium]
MGNAFDVIIAPVVTEKCSAMMGDEKNRKYTFRVRKDAGKIEIAKAVEELFKVKVSAVNVMNRAGKPKRAGRTVQTGRRADWKRAVVTLAEGTIEIM